MPTKATELSQAKGWRVPNWATQAEAWTRFRPVIGVEQPDQAGAGNGQVV